MLEYIPGHSIPDFSRVIENVRPPVTIEIDPVKVPPLPSLVSRDPNPYKPSTSTSSLSLSIE